MVTETVTESNSRRNDSNQYYKQLESIYENLFYPINEKRRSYWIEPVNNAEELVEYASNNKNDAKYLEIYTSINDDVVGTIRTIFLDFDLSTETRLEWELTHTLKDITDSEVSSAIANYEKNQNINDLTDEERTKLLTYLSNYEAEQLAGLTDEETRNYFYKKIENGYLKEPFEEAMKVANYFIEHGVEVIVNWSGSKGLHIRIPLNKLSFTDKINNDPKLFILSLGEAIETSILNKPIKKSTLDYAVLNRNKGLQRLPCSQHNTSKLYSNFINTNEKYNEAITHLLHDKSDYLPPVVDKNTNTKKFMDLAIVKEAIVTATENESYNNYNDEFANPHYTFSSENKELKENIGKVYINGHRNEIGYRTIHVLRRSGFSKEEVENIFKEIHDPQSSDYADTIAGSIKYAYSKELKKLCGLRHLIKGIKELPNFEGKENVIDYFKNNFRYYDKPTKTEVEPFRFKDRDITVTVYENHTDKWVVFSEIYEDIDLELNFNTLQGNFIKDKNKSIITFEFKYSKQLFKIADKEFKVIKEFISDEGIELPKLFVQMLKQYFKNNDSFVTAKKKISAEQELFKIFSSDNIQVRTARRKLGHYLKENGMILRRGINTPYLLDKDTNGYDSVDIDDIVMKLDEELFHNQDLVHSKDVEDAIGFIAERKRPKYNIVKFNNCLYDMTKFKVISASDEPVFTLIEVAHNYNPQAKGTKVQNFLETSLAKPNDKFESSNIEELKQGFLEMIGYILTSGNKLNAFFILSGIEGSGKGTADKIISSIFRSDKVGRLPLHELTPENKFATAHLENKQVNIVSDSAKKPIEDTGMLKAITGYDDIPVEPKGKDKYVIPKEEVPDMIVVCNNIPKFKDGIEEAVVQRVVIFEFLNQFRNTKKQNKNLLQEILDNPEEMEWLIYNGIEAYKKMISENNDFKARIDSEKARKLIGKHTDPISFILPQLVKYSDEDISDEEPVVAYELKELIMHVAKDEGLAIDHIDTNGQINARFLVGEIRDVFEINNEWTTKLASVEGYDNSVTIYPKLYKTPKFNELWEKIKTK